MKKLVISLIVGASMIFASSAFALQAMSDSTLKDTTAQAGVGITLDDVIVEIWSSGDTTYTDTDGYSGSDKIFLYTALVGMPTAAAVTPHYGDSATSLTIENSNSHKVIRANAITGLSGTTFSSPDLGLARNTGDALYNHDTTGNGVADVFMAKALTIDVGNCEIYALGLNNNIATMNAGGAYGTIAEQTIAGVIIGLPTIEIHTVDDGGTKTYTVGKAGAINDGAAYIQTTKSASTKTIHVLGGKIEIAPH